MNRRNYLLICGTHQTTPRYYSEFWCPTHERHKLEGPQGRAPKALGLVHLSHEERLGKLGLVSLEKEWLWDTQQIRTSYKKSSETDLVSSEWGRMGG